MEAVCSSEPASSNGATTKVNADVFTVVRTYDVSQLCNAFLKI